MASLSFSEASLFFLDALLWDLLGLLGLPSLPGLSGLSGLVAFFA